MIYLPALSPLMAIGYAGVGAAVAGVFVVLVLAIIVWLGYRGIRGDHPLPHALWMAVLNLTAAALYFRAVGDRADWEDPNAAEDLFQVGFGTAFAVAGVACAAVVVVRLRGPGSERSHGTHAR